MTPHLTCQAPGCRKYALVRCEHCDRALCRRHVVILRRREVAGGVVAADRMHWYLGPAEPTTAWLCEACATFTTPRITANGAHPA
jgi:hypothetical protein